MLPDASYQLPVTSYQMPVTSADSGYKFLVTGDVADYKTQVVQANFGYTLTSSVGFLLHIVQNVQECDARMLNYIPTAGLIKT